MSTFIQEFIVQTEEQWQEVNLLLDQAETVSSVNIELYNALCRSVSILIVSHLEGFIKELAKNAIRDINNNKNFNELPISIQRTYCKKFIGFDEKSHPHYHKILNDMITDFSNIREFKITHESFLFDKNRNPKPDSFKTVLSRFGVSDLFENLNQSIFDEAFSSRVTLNRLVKIMMWHVKKATGSFPYSTSTSTLKLEKTKYSNGTTLWQEFLNDTNKIRHNIVHGNLFSNSESIESLRERVNKAKLFQLVSTYLLCDKLSE